MSLQTKLARQQRFKGTIVIHQLERPKENALGLYSGNGWSPLKASFSKSPGFPTSILRPSLLSPTRFHNPPINKLTKPKPRDPDHDSIEVWDDFQKAQEFGKGLQIQCLAGGMGVAVTGRYRNHPKAGQVRYDAFLAHLVEGRMQDTLKRLLGDVNEAQKQGLKNVQLLILYRDESTLSQDPKMIWSSRMMASELRLRERLLALVEEELGEAPDLHPYHVLNEKALCITESERIVKIQNL
ncbi:hypothetical protein M406DRAFT_327216 [Cryphonectria parasitica EP155]|uniref:Uncharacterized protein n=1 Tax=Cryphonectria parasitica (strain ATCC 38755 / EP155) TaxID=660469 RepID=A0A9P5CSN1_CRYP1|nr:uncharacterized protein M406DRAFT_327216 [Cryphonectria parasitica EP155]KAF3768797.1 hypothetical protein M406DRAFT_327216 [Cryphonectria parasitica EP155]